MEQYLWQRRVRLAATVFRNDFDNLIQTALIDPVNFCFQAQNVGKARTQGVEIEASVSPIDTLLLALAYTYTDTEDRTTGDPLRRFPPNRWAITATWEALPGLVLAGEILILSSQFEASGVPRNEGYTVVNAAASYRAAVAVGAAVGGAAPPEGHQPLQRGLRRGPGLPGAGDARGGRRPRDVLSVDVTFLGSGDALGSGGRFQACLAIRAGPDHLLLDCGASSLIAMRRFGIDPTAVDAVIVSHLHGDHFGGLPFLVLAGQFGRRTRPLRIAGPPGVEARVRAAMEVLFPGSSAVARKFALEFVELHPGRETRIGAVAVTPFEVVHPSGAPALASGSPPAPGSWPTRGTPRGPTRCSTSPGTPTCSSARRTSTRSRFRIISTTARSWPTGTAWAAGGWC